MSRMRYDVRIASFLTVALTFAVGSVFAQTPAKGTTPSAPQPSVNQVAKGPTPKASTPSASRSSTPVMVDLNTASKQALMTLPGISDVSAQKIIENRPYKSKSDLTQKKVISPDAYAKIEAHVVAKTTARVSPGNVKREAASSKGTKEVTKKYQ